VRRVLSILALGVAVLLVAAGAFLGNLLTGNPYPRPDGDGWHRLRDLPRPRGEVAAAFALPGPNVPPLCPAEPCGPQLVVAGGLAGPFGRTVTDVDILDARSGRWRRGPALPEPRHHAAAASLAGAVYVSGGSRRTTRWRPERNLWVLQPGSDSWDRLPDMPEGRMAHAMVAVGGRLYVIGGRGRTSRVLIYDPATGWRAGAAMPGPRDHLAAVAAGDRIYAIGGRARGVLRRVDVYDTVTDAWAPGPALPEATSGMAAGLLRDGRIHVVAGEDPGIVGGGVLDRHFVLDLASGRWDRGPRPLLPVHGAAAGEVGGILVVAGGSRRQGAWSVLAWTGVTQRFDPRAGETGAPSPSPTATASP
jgi:hypothetical protein